MSLRARLLLTTVVLVAAGLLAANLATYRYFSGFLVKRVDEQLLSAAQPAAETLRLQGPFGDRGPPPGFHLPSGTYVELLDRSGALVLGPREYSLGVQETDIRLRLPSGLPGSDSGPARGFERFTVSQVGEGSRYRVLAAAATYDEGVPGTLIVAIPLAEADRTLHSLVGVDLVVSLVVLALVAGLALWLVRVGLRPLVGIGETAGAIAAGDLSRRVEPADERTEVGRLGLALNEMLAQIETAFEERRASEARLRRFVGDASHELRTPLTSIRGYAELFRRGAGERPEDLAKTMARIEEEASRMGVMVDDLLLLARLDQGRPLEREPVDVGRIAEEAVDGARALEPERPVDLEVEGPARVVGDEGRLRQVVSNLLANARVHTPPGTPVHVRVLSQDEQVVLSVSDEGPGLSPEASERVFERFYRGDPSRSRETGGGAGLGLSIVAAIVRAHGGTVHTAAANGGGATFEVRLPVHPPDPDGSDDGEAMRPQAL